MENNQLRIHAENNPPASSFKWKVYLVLLVIICGIGGYGYWWFKDTNALRMKAIGIIEQAQKYDILQSAVKGERMRCENFIAQKEGDFGSFEYCKKLIDWSDTLPISN